MEYVQALENETLEFNEFDIDWYSFEKLLLTILLTRLLSELLKSSL